MSCVSAVKIFVFSVGNRVLIRGFILTLGVRHVATGSSLGCVVIFSDLSEACDVFSEVRLLFCWEVGVGVSAPAVACTVPPDVPIIAHIVTI